MPKKLPALVPDLEPELEEDELHSWAPIDIDDILDGKRKIVKPDILERTDGHPLFYKGKTHSISGEPESGKTWMALLACVEVLNQGGRVAYVDFEDDAPEIVDRLLLLGAERERLRTAKDQFRYVRPETAAGDPEERDEDFQDLIDWTPQIAILDGVTESLSLEGLSTKETDDIALWMKRLGRPLAKVGAAVVVIDHVTKATDGRGRFSFGAQHKLAGISGAAYLVAPRQLLYRGAVGEFEIRVGKDRPSGVRPFCGPYNSADRTAQAAILRLDARQEGVIGAELMPPDETKSASEQKQEKKQNKDFDIAWALCGYLQNNPGAGSRVIRKDIKFANADIDRVMKKLRTDNFVRVEPGAATALKHYLTAENVHQTEAFERAWLG